MPDYKVGDKVRVVNGAPTGHAHGWPEEMDVLFEGEYAIEAVYVEYTVAGWLLHPDSLVLVEEE